MREGISVFGGMGKSNGSGLTIERFFNAKRQRGRASRDAEVVERSRDRQGIVQVFSRYFISGEIRLVTISMIWLLCIVRIRLRRAIGTQCLVLLDCQRVRNGPGCAQDFLPPDGSH